MSARQNILAGALTAGIVLTPAAAFCQSSSALAFGADALTLSGSSLVFPSEPIRTETATTIEVTLPADVLFDFDKADIRASAQTTLHEVADMIRTKASGGVTIQGYTDALGKDAYNQALSERRAGAVNSWLATKEGLAAARFTTAGFGPRNPVAPNRKPDGSDDPEGRQLNRRVTLIIRK